MTIIKQRTKPLGFTTETQRSRREDFFVCRGGARQTKSFYLEQIALAEGLGGPGESVPPDSPGEHVSQCAPCLERVPVFWGRVGGENQFECKLFRDPGNR